MALLITELSGSGRGRQGEQINVEGSTVNFQSVAVTSGVANSGSAISGDAHVVRLEPEEDTHFKFGSSNAGTGDEKLKVGQVYYKQVDGGETPQTYGP